MMNLEDLENQLGDVLDQEIIETLSGWIVDIRELSEEDQAALTRAFKEQLLDEPTIKTRK